MLHSRRRLLRLGAGLTLGAFLSGHRAWSALAARLDIEPAQIDVLTVLVGGLDSREPGQPENADVFIIARVNVPRRIVRAVSVPRDLYVQIPGFGYDKITRTYDFGSKAADGAFRAGAETMKATVAANFGVEADAVAVTTFDGFERVVDALGGIVVDNPYDLYDGLYPTIDYGTEEIFFPQGVQLLDGEQALKYVRTRHQDGDPGRIMRQRIVLEALFERATSPENVDRLPDLVHRYRRVVRNNLGASRRLALALAAPEFASESIQFTDLLPFVYSDTTSEGMWIYSGDWSQIPAYVQSFLAGAN